MRGKFLKVFLVTALLLGTTCATGVQANEGENGGGEAYVQTPVETIIQVVLTGIALKILDHFNLP
jgi:hypothetical protein